MIPTLHPIAAKSPASAFTNAIREALMDCQCADFPCRRLSLSDADENAGDGQANSFRGVSVRGEVDNIHNGGNAA